VKCVDLTVWDFANAYGRRLKEMRMWDSADAIKLCVM